MSDGQNLSEKLRILIKSQNLSKSDLAKVLGKDRSTVSKWANYNATLSDADIAKIIEHYNIGLGVEQFKVHSIADFSRALNVTEIEATYAVAELPSGLINGTSALLKEFFTTHGIGCYNVWTLSAEGTGFFGDRRMQMERRIARLQAMPNGTIFECMSRRRLHTGFAWLVFDKEILAIAEETLEMNEIMQMSGRMGLSGTIDDKKTFITGVFIESVKSVRGTAASPFYMERTNAAVDEAEWEEVKQVYNQTFHTTDSFDIPADETGLEEADQRALRALRGLTGIGNGPFERGAQLMVGPALI